MPGSIVYPPQLTVPGEHLAYRHGYQPIQKFGRNPDLDTLDGEVLIWHSGTTYPYQTSAQTIEALSASADDAAAGTGAQKVKISGLDENWDVIHEEVTLDGVTPVTTTQTFLRVYRAAVTDVGSGNINAGDITIRVSPGGSTLASLPAGEGSTFLSLLPIPRGHEGYLYDYEITTDAALNSEITARVRTRKFGEAFRTSSQFIVNKESPARHEYKIPMRLEAKTDLAFTAQSSNNDRTVYCQFTILVVPV